LAWQCYRSSLRQGAASHGFLGKFGIAFTPEAVKVLTAAFDDAWARLEASGAPYSAPDTPKLPALTWQKYHRHRAARRMGPEKLSDDALLYLSRQKLSRKPPPLGLP
jgi:hypothetical protein